MPPADVGYSAGSARVRLPKGRYALGVSVVTPDSSVGSGRTITVAWEPGYAVDQDSSLTIDAAQATQTGIGYDRPDAAVEGFNIGFFFQTERGVNSDEWLGGGAPDDLFVRPSETSVAPGVFTYRLMEAAGRRDQAGTYTDTPYAYIVRWTQDGRVPTDLVRAVHDRDLGRINDRIARSAAGQKAWLGGIGPLPTPERSPRTSRRG